MGKYSYGWRPDLPDQRKHQFELGVSVLGKHRQPQPQPTPSPTPTPTPVPPPPPLPTSIDLIPLCPPIYDQGASNSCTAQAIAGAIEIDQVEQGLPVYTPSRLFIYYGERVIEGTVNSDSGAMTQDGMTVIHQQGAPHETLWPFDPTQFAVQPPSAAYTDGLLHKSIAYEIVAQNMTAIRQALASKYPIAAGIAVYPSLEDAPNGVVPLPGPTEPLLGGHCILLVGYDDASQTCKFRNSWGVGWGNQGYGTIPYAYLTNQSIAGGGGYIGWVVSVMS